MKKRPAGPENTPGVPVGTALLRRSNSLCVGDFRRTGGGHEVRDQRYAGFHAASEEKKSMELTRRLLAGQRGRLSLRRDNGRGHGPGATVAVAVAVAVVPIVGPAGRGRDVGSRSRARGSRNVASGLCGSRTIEKALETAIGFRGVWGEAGRGRER